jgi:uncharacterized repeat protein (TIGR02543 family)
MLRHWNRILAFVLAFALVITTFGSDFANAKVYAETNEQEENIGEGSGSQLQDAGEEENNEEDSEEPEEEEEEEEEAEEAEEPEEPEEPEESEVEEEERREASADEEEEEKSETEEGEGLPVPEEEGAIPEGEPTEEDEPEADPAKGASTITINYVAREGGSVSRDTEKLSEPYKAEGSKASDAEGYGFVNWTDEDDNPVWEEREFIPEGDYLVDGATYYANFEKTDYTVNYLVDGSEFDTRGFSKGDTLTIPSENPFKAGYFFRGWNYNGEIITSDNVSDYTVNQDMVLNAELEEIKIFEATVEYYYVSPDGQGEVTFDSQTIEVEKYALPATIVSPPETQVDDDTYPVYYPTETSVQITTDDISNPIDYRQEGAVVVGILSPRRVEYKPTEFSFYYVYMLKDLTGDGYTEVQREQAYGVKNTEVTPKVIDITGGEFESTKAYKVTEEGQELPVYYTRVNYRLEFDSNGGSYIEPVTAPYETVIDISGKNPTYNGYSFDDWYTDEACTIPAGDNFKLEKDTTLFAKWIPATVRYTMVYMIENANDNGYSYYGSATANATVDSTVEANADSPKPSGFDTRNFVFKDSSNAVVKADGSTAITVRYDRRRYTISWNGDVYNIDSQRRATGQGSASVTAKYEQDISHEFNQEFMVNKNHKYAWCLGCAVNNNKIVSWDTMPSVYDSRFKTGFVNTTTGVITAVAFDFSTTKMQKLYYWLENYEGTQTTTHNGKTYGLFNYVEGRFNYLYQNVDFYDIAGYTQDDVTFSKRGYKWGNYTPDETMTVNMYYNAAKYPLTFNNYDGTNISTADVTLGSNITNNFTAAERAAKKPASDARWDKWYTDSAHNVAYTGNYKMPTGLVLYANWIIPDRKITFYNVDPVTGQSSVLETKTYPHNETAASITPASISGFTFGGWYVDSQYSEKYDFNKPMTKDISVYAYWIPDEISYTVRFISYDEDGQEFEVAPTRTERSPAFQPGDVKTEKAAAVAGMLPDESEKQITLTNGENILTFYYVAKPEQINYKVRYIYMDGDKEIEVAKEHNGTVPGSQTSITVAAEEADPDFMRANPEYAPYADGSYYPEEVVLSHSFTYTESNNVITFYYHPYKMGKIIVNFVDMDGNSIADQVTKNMMPGGQYVINTNLGGNYILNRIEDEDGNPVTSTRVIAIDGTVERTVYYQKKLVIGANGKTKTYDGEPLVSTFTADDYYIEGLIGSHRLTGLSFDGSQTEVGSSTTTPKDAVLAGSPNVNDYYVIEYKSGTLTVTALDGVIVNIVADNIEAVYDGRPHTAKYTVESIVGDAFKEEYIGHTGELSITSTDVIDADLAAHFFVLEQYAKNFTNVKFNVSDGGLKITPKALTVKTPDKITTYPTPATTGELSETDARAAVQGWVGNDGGKLGACDGIKYNVIDDDDLVDEAGNHYYENTVGQPEVLFDEGTNADNYYIDWDNSTMGKLIVKPRPITVKATGHVSDPDPIVYDAQPHTVSGYDMEVLSDDPADKAYRVEGDVLDYEGPAQDDISVTKTDVGNYPLGIKEDGSQFTNINTNYEVTFIGEDGYLDIVAAEAVVVRVTGNSNTVIYNGQEQEVTGYGLEIVSDPTGLYTTSKVSGPEQSAARAAGTNVNTYSMGLKAADFTNTDKNFDVTFEIKDGTLKIEKAKIEVEVTGNTDTVQYNGDDQSVTGYTIEGVWLVNTADRQDATALYTAFTKPEQSAAIATGKDARQEAYPMNLSAESFTNTDKTNFEVTFNVTNGWIKINKLPVTVTVTGNSATKEYNGEEQSVSGYTANADSTLYKAEYYDGPAQDAAVVTAKGTFVDTYTMTVTADDFAANDDPANANFDVAFEVTPGTLEIIPNKTELTVYVKGNSATYVYDGSVKSVEGWVVDGSIDETVTVLMRADKLAYVEGQEVNLEGYKMGLESSDFEAFSDNYEKITVVLKEDGKLIITPADDRPVPTATGYEGEYDGENHTVTLSEGGRVTGDEYIFTYVDPADQSKTVDAESAPVIKNVSESIGYVTVTIKNHNYNDVILDPVPLNIFKKEVKVSTGSGSKAYDGTPLTNEEAAIEGLVGNESATVKANGSQTEVGGEPHNNTYDPQSITWVSADEGNYQLVEDENLLGTLTVTANTATIILTAPSATKAYDGTKLEATGIGEGLSDDEKVIATGLPEGFKFFATAEAEKELIDVGTAANKVATYKIVLADDLTKDVTSNFSGIITADGTLTITPAQITVATDTPAAKVYDGTPLVAGGNFSVTGGKDGAATASDVITVADNYNPDTKVFTKAIDLLNGEKLLVSIDGSQTEVGTSNNDYSFKWDDAATTAKAGNYEVSSESIGTLTVKHSEKEIVVTVTGYTGEYDGQEHAAKVEQIDLPEGYVLGEATTDAKATDVTEGDGIPAKLKTLKILDLDGNDVTKELTITKIENQFIKITPKKLTVTTPTTSKPFDGTPLTAEGSYDGLIEGETVEFKTTGTVTYPSEGTVDNSYELKWTGAKAGNYELVEDIGKLSITKNEDAKISITAPSDSKVYDGTPLTFEGKTLTDELTVEGLPAGATFVVSATTEGTVTDAEKIDNVIKTYDIYLGETKVTEFFGTPTFNKGELEVTPAALYVTTPTASKNYDGFALTAEGSIEGFVNNESAEFTTTGKVTYPGEGTVDNTYKLVWTNAKEKNYDLIENIGTLTVYDRPLDERFIIYATPLNGGSVVYDGQEKNDFDYTLSWEVGGEEAAEIEIPEVVKEEGFFAKAAGAIRNAADAVVDFVSDLFTIKTDAKEKADTYSDGTRTYNATVNAEVKADRTAKDVGNYILSMDEATLGNFSVTDGAGEDVTRQFVVLAKGTDTFEITPAPVTVTAENKSKTSGGAEPTLTAKVEPENANLYAEALSTVKYSLSRKAGERAGKYPITATGDALQGNFAVTYVPGEMVISGGTPVPPTPTPDPTPIPDDPTPTAPTPTTPPTGDVLGARRDDAVADAPAVLGARRGRTEDETNTTARVIVILASVAAAIALLLTGKKKEEEEK